MAELKGKIIAVLPLASGVSNKTGKEWASQEYVIEEVDARYPQRVCFRVFGSEKIQQFALQIGDVVTVKLEFGAREYNGKWYNEINCWGVEKAQDELPQQQTAQPYSQQPQNAPQPQQGYGGQQPGYNQQQSQYAPPQGGYQQPPRGYAQQPPQQEDLPF